MRHSNRTHQRVRRTLLLWPLALAMLGSTCVVVEEEPVDGSYADESTEQKVEDENVEEVMTESAR